MNTVVWSYPIGAPGAQFTVLIPRGAEHVDTFSGSEKQARMRWVVDPHAETREHRFRVVAEGEVMDFAGKPRGSFHRGGSWWFVFEVIA